MFRQEKLSENTQTYSNNLIEMLVSVAIFLYPLSPRPFPPVPFLTFQLDLGRFCRHMHARQREYSQGKIGRIPGSVGVERPFLKARAISAFLSPSAVIIVHLSLEHLHRRKRFHRLTSPSLESLDTLVFQRTPLSEKRASSYEIWNPVLQQAPLISSNRLIWCPVYIMTGGWDDSSETVAILCGRGRIVADREHLPEAMASFHQEHVITVRTFNLNESFY